MAILKKVIQDIILSNQEMILNLELYQRELVLEPQANHVIVGPRRSGKTYLLYQFIQDHLSSKENAKRIIFINFEDDRLLEFRSGDFQLILDGYFELFTEKPVFFLDEIQNIDHWHKFARRLVDTHYQVFITGSNATMLSKEMATTLGGRFLITENLPLSFVEYLRFHKIEVDQTTLVGPHKASVKQLFNEYFKYGGFPELLKYSDKRGYLSTLFQKLFYSDIVIRNKIKNDKALHLLVKKMAESVNNETSATRIKNIIKAIGYPVGTATVLEYMRFLNDSYLLFPVLNYVNKFVARETIKKYYFVDNGLLSLFIHNQDSKLLENLVYLHLARSNESIYYFKRNQEVDFYLPEKDLLIQVCYDISDPDTQKRELQALKKVNDELKATHLLIISHDEEKELSLDKRVVPVIPIWKFLLINYSNFQTK
ncbi:MAG: ATP-binding protein [Candidatus Marinimicrobia bacterium]|nr:ATP-binding protein [Candidatus Neomarinimicrobiota bacterium]